MFRGEETIRIRTGMRGPEVEGLIEHALARLERVRFYKGGVFEVTGPRLGSAMSVTEVTGRLFRGRRDDEWIVDVEYAVRPSTLCWVLLVLGVVFLFLLGLLLLLIPYTTKGEVQRVVANAPRAANTSLPTEPNTSTSAGRGIDSNCGVRDHITRAVPFG